MIKKNNKKKFIKAKNKKKKEKNKELTLKSIDYLFSKSLDLKKQIENFDKKKTNKKVDKKKEGYFFTKKEFKELEKKIIIQVENYCKKNKVRMPKKYKFLYCKKCKRLYSEKSIRRIKKLKYKTLNITCEHCGFLRRIKLE